MAKSDNVFSVFSAVSKDVGIDLGTANTVIFVKDKGVALRESSVVAVDVRTDEVLAAGKEAKEMLGKTPETMEVVCPVKDGVVADFGACAAMMKYYLHKAVNTSFFNKPRVVLSIPSGITDVERRAVEDAVKQAGAGSVNLMEAPMAAAIGAGLPVGSPRGTMIANIGAGVTEVAVISLGDIVASTTARGGSDAIDRGIIVYMKRKHSLQIGVLTAENVKLKIGSAYPTDDSFNTFMEVKGRSVVDGLPKSITVQADEIREVINEEVKDIIRVIMRTMEETPAELAADVVDQGILLAGGGCQLRGLDKYIEQETGLKTTLAERPVDCIAEGLGKSLDLVFSGRDIRKTRRIR